MLNSFSISYIETASFKKMKTFSLNLILYVVCIICTLLPRGALGWAGNPAYTACRNEVLNKLKALHYVKQRNRDRCLALQPLSNWQ